VAESGAIPPLPGDGTDADERDRMAARRDRPADLPETLDREWAKRRENMRAALADQATRTAELADSFAALLERNAVHGDAERRLTMAAAEREIARIHRRNAARLRRAGAGLIQPELEHLPRIPLFEWPAESPPNERPPG
jgi:hypothetical protein